MGAAEKFACLVALAVFAGGAVGLILQRLLPDEFTTGPPARHDRRGGRASDPALRRWSSGS